jgi:phage tail tape-measure protein
MGGRPAAEARLQLSARVSSDQPAAVRVVLEELFPAGAVSRTGGEFVVEASVTGTDAKELNRALLSRLRKAEKRTRIRARWTAADGTVYSFFDYVLKKRSRP